MSDTIVGFVASPFHDNHILVSRTNPIICSHFRYTSFLSFFFACSFLSSRLCLQLALRLLWASGGLCPWMARLVFMSMCPALGPLSVTMRHLRQPLITQWCHVEHIYVWCVSHISLSFLVTPPAALYSPGELRRASREDLPVRRCPRPRSFHAPWFGTGG